MSLLNTYPKTEHLKLSNTAKQQKKNFGLSFSEYQFFNSHLYSMMPLLTHSTLFLKGIANLNELDEMNNLSNMETVDNYIKWNNACEKNVTQLKDNISTLITSMNFNSKYSPLEYENVYKILLSNSTSYRSSSLLKPTVRVSEIESLNRVAKGLCKTDIVYNGSTLAYHLMRAFYIYSLPGYAGKHFTPVEKNYFRQRSLGWLTFLNPNENSYEDLVKQKEALLAFTNDVRKLSFY
jgi:hypothetical protein